MHEFRYPDSQSVVGLWLGKKSDALHTLANVELKIHILLLKT